MKLATVESTLLFQYTLLGVHCMMGVILEPAFTRNLPQRCLRQKSCTVSMLS